MPLESSQRWPCAVQSRPRTLEPEETAGQHPKKKSPTMLLGQLLQDLLRPTSHASISLVTSNSNTAHRASEQPL